VYKRRNKSLQTNKQKCTNKETKVYKKIKKSVQTKNKSLQTKKQKYTNKETKV